MTQRADVPAVMTKLKARTDKYNAEVVKKERGSAITTKVTSTTTALVKEEFGGDGIQNTRKVIAGAQEQLEFTSSLLKQR